MFCGIFEQIQITFLLFLVGGKISLDKQLTGYPSIDKPWLKYYTDEAINSLLPNCSMYQFVWENNKDHLDDIALEFLGKEISYRDLFTQIDQLANAFVAIGIKENDIVTLMMINQPETVYCLYALNKVGAVANMINVFSGTREIERYLDEGESKYLIAVDLFYEKCYLAAKNKQIRQFITIPLFNSCGLVKRIGYKLKVKTSINKNDRIVMTWNQLKKNDRIERPVQKIHNPAKCSVIGHTSGTTGFPKGVLISDNSINAIAAPYDKAFEHKRQESLLNLIVPFALYGLVVNLHMPLSLGMKVILVPKVEPEKTDELILKHKPNYVISVPIYWTALIDSTEIQDLSFLKIAAAGGAGSSKEQIAKLNDLLKKYNAKTGFLIGYGMSENGATACSQMNGCAKEGSVGIPLVKNTVSIFDPVSLEEKKYYEIGEICITGPSMMLGYIKNENETNKMLRKHRDGSVWLHTGDLGHMDEEGFVFVQGRMNRVYMTQHNGAVAKIYPEAIEKVINKHEAVKESCAVCISNKPNFFKPVVFCVLNENCSMKQDEVASILCVLCEKELPEYDIPVKIFFPKEIPHNAQGKIDYRVLEKEAEQMKNRMESCS